MLVLVVVELVEVPTVAVMEEEEEAVAVSEDLLAEDTEMTENCICFLSFCT